MRISPIEEAIEDIRAGRMIILVDDEPVRRRRKAVEPNRITSYNVCYTKLLRLGTAF